MKPCDAKLQDHFATVIVPAQPGYMLLEFALSEPGIPPSFVFSPILAWRVESFWYEKREEWTSMAIPVTAEYISDGFAIQYPDGTIVFPEDRRFKDYNA